METNQKRLAILVCSLHKRRTMLNRLCNILTPQKTDTVEILVACDDGEMSIGNKRRKLIETATADYICFVDDDDRVAPNYVEAILKSLENSPDCVGLEGVITFDGRGPRTFIHSLKYDHWFERDGIYYRTPNHLNPVKRSIALQSTIPDTNHGEDSAYSSSIFPLLKTEAYIEGPIYFYDYRTSK